MLEVLVDLQATWDSYANVAHSDASRPQIKWNSPFGITERLKKFCVLYKSREFITVVIRVS